MDGRLQLTVRFLQRSTTMNKPNETKPIMPAYPRGAVPEEPEAPRNEGDDDPRKRDEESDEESDDDRESSAAEQRPPADS